MNKGRVYAMSDVHGCWEPFKKAMDYLQPEDTLYFLGDSTDRNPDGVKIFQTLVSDPRVKMIKGNHDQMMADAIPFVWGEIEDIHYYGGNGYRLWYHNGGDVTARAFWNMTKEEVYAIKDAVDNMPTKMIYNSPCGHHVILEHAGYTPYTIPHRTHDPLWDREHFYDEWDYLAPANVYVVHGHTPVQYLKFDFGYNGQPQLTKEEMKQKKEWFQKGRMRYDWKPEIIRYCEGHKFDIDLCTIVSNRIALLNLDTFEAIYFDGDKE